MLSQPRLDRKPTTRAPRLVVLLVGVSSVVLALLFVPLGPEAQPQQGKVHRLGVLVPTTPPGPSEPWGAVLHCLAGLRELGYVEGRNLVVERRYAEGKVDRLPGLARDLVRLKVDALFVVSSSAVLAARDATTKIPIVEWREHVVEGGLMAYGSSMAERSRRAAAYVDRIFTGVSPADLPVEQPTKFELVVNLKTAKALALAIPPSIQARVDELIQ